MNRILALLLAAVLICLMTACQDQGEPDPTFPPGSNGASKPTSKEPPILTIQDGSGSEINANLGTYSWTYANDDGTMSGICADSSHPLEWKEFLAPLTTDYETVTLHFDVPPQELTIRCWSDDHWGQMNAKSKTVSLDGWDLELKKGGYIYEVIATWTGENLAAEGTAYYGFYVIHDNQSNIVD